MKSIGPMQCSREPLQTWKKGNSSNVKSFQCVFRSSDQCQTPIRQMLTQSKSLGLVLFKDCIWLKKKRKTTHLYFYESYLERLLSHLFKEISDFRAIQKGIIFPTQLDSKGCQRKAGRRKKLVKRKTMNQYE